MSLLDHLRPQPGWKDPDPKVRRDAARSLTDTAVLIDLARHDADPAVRTAADGALLRLALGAADETTALAAFDGISEPRALTQVARSAASERVSRAALGRLSDARALGSVARHGTHPSVRLDALGRIDDVDEIEAVALKSPHDDAALAALERLAGRLSEGDAGLIERVAGEARARAAVRRARVLLHERTGETGKAPPLTDRAAQTRLCEQVERLAQSADCEALAGALAAAQHDWDDLIPDIDDDLAERFAAACRAARERLAANQEERARSRRVEEEREDFVARHVAPRRALCAAVETAPEADLPRVIEETLWEWDRLAPVDDPDVAPLRARFDAAVAAALARRTEWERREELAARRAAETTARAEREKAERDNAARLRKLCERGERIVAAENVPLKKAEPALREARAALDDPGPIAGRGERGALMKRLAAIQAALAPRVRELRDREDWKRWANANVQEDLCARAETLAALDDPRAAARGLARLHEAWKTASAASQGKAQGLWARFKAADDAVRARVDAWHAGHQARKEDLCGRAEALSESTDWGRTAAALRALQAEWKTIGPAGKSEKLLWQRFQTATGRFFARRKEDLAGRKEEWAKNQALREALCSRAEALAESADWKDTAAALKALQAEWKTIGPVRPEKSEAMWRRFRRACDRFFERYKRRDAIDVETRLAARAAIVRELEALVPSPAAAPDPGAAEGAALDRAPLAESLGALRRRWQESPPVPAAQLAPLALAFEAAFERVVAACPTAVGGTDLDPGRNRARLEDLCERIERLMPAAPREAPRDEALSPASRLAALWVEALASNTIGGKAAQASRWRAAAEEVRKARDIWQRVGYVPESQRRPLAERFEHACRQIDAEHAKAGEGAPDRGGEARGARAPAKRGRGPGQGAGRDRAAGGRGHAEAPGRRGGGRMP